jgi:bleomycin hydrolase
MNYFLSLHLKMTKRILYLLILISLTACHHRQKVVFTDEVRLPMTPVKDQGQTSFCWAYAMLATIETEHIARGDSVNLSPAYIERVVKRRNLRGMGHTLLNIIGRYGIVSYDAYPDSSYHKLPQPRWVFMLGARYTPLEFAHSVCAPDEYIALTTNDNYPYYKEVVLDVPDNWEHNKFLNIPKDSLLAHVESAIRHRHAVCWEGDTNEYGFSFKEGIADGHFNTTPTDNHCMAIVGIARDPQHRLFFTMKNSWGTRNPYDGLMYMSAAYLRDKTVAVYMTKEAYENP